MALATFRSSRSRAASRSRRSGGVGRPVAHSPWIDRSSRLRSKRAAVLDGPLPQALVERLPVDAGTPHQIAVAGDVFRPAGVAGRETPVDAERLKRAHIPNWVELWVGEVKADAVAQSTPARPRRARIRSRSSVPCARAIRLAALTSAALFCATSGADRGVFQRQTWTNSARVYQPRCRAATPIPRCMLSSS